MTIPAGFKPMLAEALPAGQLPVFPCYVSPKLDGAGQAWPVKQVEKWLYEMQILREALGLLDLRKLPKPEDRGLFDGVRVEV
jgi:hypothetical protein